MQSSKETRMESTVVQLYESAQERIRLLTRGSTSWPGSRQTAVAVFEATGIPARAKREGDVAPDVTLPDALGRPTRLSDSWGKGLLVVILYGSGWCSYCSL